MLPFHSMYPRYRMTRRRLSQFLIIVTCFTFVPLGITTADHTPTPTTVVIAADFQSELGCPGDYQPDCANSGLAYDANDDVWQAVFALPAGSWRYKAALNQGWDENYGLNAMRDGAEIPLSLAASTDVKFYYDHKSHWITDNRNSVIAIAPGSFQSELGCPGDWQPDCLRSWLQDPDGDDIYTFTTVDIPPGDYEAKVAINESWDENYGANGVLGGSSIPFSVPTSNATVTFVYNATTHVLEIVVAGFVDLPIVVSSPSDEGESVAASATFEDFGTSPYSCTIDYGDGTGPQAGVVSDMTCSGPDHTYVEDSGAGSYTVTIIVTDSLDNSHSNDVDHIVNNVSPTITGITTGPVQQGQPVTVTVNASDPAGVNDPLAYAFDCDDNGIYETPGIANQGTCTLNPGVAVTVVSVRVSDDDSGVTTDTILVEQTAQLCASYMTGSLSLPTSGACPSGYIKLTLPASQPTTLCISLYTGKVSWSPRGCPTSGYLPHVVPDDGPLPYCASRWTGGLRATFGSQQCKSHELAGVIPG